MFKVLSSWFGFSLCILGYFCATTNPALAEARLALEKETAPRLLAQVTSDDTVNTQVTENGNTAEITGGETRGDNLFHSFQDFSVKTGNEAFFNNADSISNIFSRVTGGNVSDIDGAIRANGSANLFLINPAGIIFGENASLNIGGSFYGSSASSILFEDGEFSAVDLDNPPLLTVNAPIGLGFRDEPGDIVNRSGAGNQNNTNEVIGLEVSPGKNLAFIGGNVKFDAGEASASGGNIDLGGLSAAGTVGINPDGSLSFPESVPRADISLAASEVYVQGINGGNITINARRVNLSDGNSKDDVIGSQALIAGSIKNSTSKAKGGDITINATESITLEDINILNSVGQNTKGDAGEVNITTTNLFLNNSEISSSTYGQGNAGSINIKAIESITFDDFSGISAITAGGDNGDAGEINISTANLFLKNGFIEVYTFGAGNGGLININASELMNIEGFGSISSEANGNAIGVEEGNGGEIKLTTANLYLGEFSSILADTNGKGNGGLIDINVTESMNIVGGEISASTYSFDAENIAQGNGGNITIYVADTLSINATTETTGIFASNQGNSTGNAGNIGITTRELSLINGGQINSFTRGSGNAGNTTINAQDSIFLSGKNSEGFFSGVSNDVEEAATGNGGTISITTENLDLVDGASMSTFSSGKGDAGLIDVNADVVALDNGEISAEAFKNADGGNLKIDADVIVAFPGKDSDIRASAEQGDGGNITINAESVLGIEERPLNDSTNDINASSELNLDGTVNINTSDINPIQGATELPSNIVEARQTADQTCSADRDGRATNGLAIAGRGGIHPAPDTPLNSENISNENPAQASIPQPLETSQGKIQPARGIKVSESGKISLTAYRTDNAGERIPEIKPNCN